MTAPTVEPISLAEAKMQCRITGDDEDALLSGMIGAVRASLDGRDGWFGRSITTQTWDLKLDEFPRPGAALALPLPPLQSVTSITYRDGDGSHIWAAEEYAVIGVGAWEGGSIVAAEGYSWPGTDGTAECVTVRFVAGYGGSSPVPEPIRAAMLLMVEDMYDRPETTTLRERAMALLRPYRLVTL